MAPSTSLRSSESVREELDDSTRTTELSSDTSASRRLRVFALAASMAADAAAPCRRMKGRDLDKYQTRGESRDEGHHRGRYRNSERQHRFDRPPAMEPSRQNASRPYPGAELARLCNFGKVGALRFREAARPTSVEPFSGDGCSVRHWGKVRYLAPIRARY